MEYQKNVRDERRVDDRTDSAHARAHTRPRRSAPKASLLSFVWPGAGQWYLGQRIAAFIYALPPLLVVGALVVLATDGLESLAGRLFDPPVALTIVVGLVLLGLWRLLSMADAWSLGRRREHAFARGAEASDKGRSGRGRLAAVVTLAAIVIVVHAVPAGLAFKFYEAGSAIFQPDGGVAAPPPAEPAPTPSPVPEPTPDPAASPDPAAPSPTRTPIPTIPPDVTDDGLVNVLFVGTDSLPRRPADHRLADSITLASFDPVNGTIDMVSIPRNVSRFPQYWGGFYEGKINTLLSNAQADPGSYPDGPMETFVEQISYLVGVDIDYYATMDIPGFQRLVDAVGGIEVEVTEPIADPAFPLYLDVGTHQLDGVTAMMYVRSRKGPGGSNEQRSYRQQQVILELRRKLSDPQMLPRLPEVLDAMADTVRTNLPSGRLGETLRLAQQASDAEISQVFLGPETYARELRGSETDLEYAVELRMDAVADYSLELWGASSYYSDPAYLAELMAAQEAGSR
ncbi:MAG: LCP family protein [Chloroflexota bacterium]|nr:LCP family protein [Chloroflexota bacterium]